jgi:hypothetical protein
MLLSSIDKGCRFFQDLFGDTRLARHLDIYIENPGTFAYVPCHELAVLSIYVAPLPEPRHA